MSQPDPWNEKKKWGNNQSRRGTDNTMDTRIKGQKDKQQSIKHTMDTRIKGQTLVYMDLKT